MRMCASNEKVKIKKVSGGGEAAMVSSSRERENVLSQLYALLEPICQDMF